MALNTFLTPQWITTDVAMFWDNELRFLRQFDRTWDDSFRNKPEGAQIGSTLQVRLPQRFNVTEGAALVEQAILNQTTTISVNHQKHIGMGWSSAQSALEVEEVQSRYTKPAGRSLASDTDKTAGLETYQSIYFSAGTPGTPLSSFSTWLDAVAKLENVGVPGPYCAVVDPKTQAKLVATSLVQFNPQSRISEYFETGKFGENALGIEDWYADPLMPTHTTGTFTSSTPLVDGALQTGSTLVLKGLGTYSFNAGDSFTLLGVNSINPIAYSDTGDLQEFVITTPVSGAGGVTLNISPAIITSGQIQTVTQSPPNNATVSFRGATGTVNATMSAQTSRQSILMNGNALAFVMVDLPDNLPGAKSAFARDKDAGITMRWAEQWNILTDRKPSRVDIMYGTAVILPYFAQRMWS